MNKQIEEMAKDLENHTCMSEYQAEIASKMLYIKGYRKASEVSREIFAEIGELINQYLDGRIYTHDFCTYLAELKKKYTEGEG